MYARAPHVCLVPQRPEESVGLPLTTVADGCEPLRGCWEWNLGLLQEHQVFSNAEPSLQPPPPL